MVRWFVGKKAELFVSGKLDNPAVPSLLGKRSMFIVAGLQDEVNSDLAV